MKVRDVIVTNPSGIHARPASNLVKLANTFNSSIFISKNGSLYNAKSILNLLAAEIHRGSEIKIHADGSDEDAALDAIAEAISSGLGEIV